MNTKLPLSTNQLDIYVDQMRWADSSHLNIGAIAIITGKLDTQCFNRALNQLICCNPGLRVRISESSNKPFQFVAEYQDENLNLVNFSNYKNGEELAKKYIENDFQKPFVIDNSPLFCFQLIRVNNQKHLWYGKFHHVIVDGWGTSLVFQEVIRNYNQIINNGKYEQEERDFTLINYLQEESEYRQSKHFYNDITYWTQRLQDVSPKIFNEITKPKLLGARKAIYIKREQYNRVEAICQQTNSNAFHFILSILFVYLTKRYRQNDLVIGLPILNRSKKSYKSAIGLFISMVPFRMEINHNETLTDILTTVRTLLKQDFRHQRFPLGEMKRVANLDSNSDSQNLFEVTLSYEKHNYSEHFENTQTICVPLYSSQQKTPLAIYVREFDSESDVKIDFDYNLSYFDTETIEQIVTHFQKLFGDALESLEQNLNKQILEFSLLSTQTYRRLTQPLNVNSSTSETLVSAFEKIVSEYPQHTAVKFENVTLTYAELNQRANSLAHYLRSLGVKPETRVGLCLERSENMVVAILGVLKAGAAYVPLDPNYPASRLEFILEDSCASLLIVETSSCQLISTEIDVLNWASIWESIPNKLDSPPQLLLHPQNPAYIIYTSGSTGTPKGCVVTHTNVIRLMRSTEAWFNFNASDVWTLFHSFAFDFSVWELWGALLYGGKVVIVPFWLSRSREAFRELLTLEKVTVLSQTPSAFLQLIRADNTSTSQLALRYVIFGGEALNLESLRPWFERHGDQTPRLVNMYGITETTVHVTYRPISLKDLTATASVIGEPISDLCIYLLDDNLEPVPTGWTGEIFVAGAGVTRGYFNRPALTAERFIPNPFGNGRLYRSGDLGRWTNNGDLEYLGRTDNQVKIRGFRIELGEIQAPLASHEQIQQAFVTTYGVGEDKRLVAYYVGKEPQPTISELNQYLQSRLPNYMIPTAYVSLDAFPLTVNGKIDTLSLPKPNLNLSRQNQYVSPHNEQQRRLCAIWEEVLTQKQVGIEDNFFEMGGDSIRAMQVVGQAQNENIQISIKDIFENPTIRQLTALRELSSVAIELSYEFSDVASINLLSEEDKEHLPQDAEDAYQLSSLQAGMLYHSELHPGTAIFHDIFTFYLRLPYAEDAWKKALSDICQAHPILRTSFDWTKYSTPLQIVHRGVELPLTVYDLRYQGENAKQLVKEWVELEKANSFDVRRPPLFRFVIHRISDDSISLSFSFHHAILDGWSVATLITQLLQRYIQYVSGQQETLLTPSITYKDFIAQEKQAIANEEMRQFWRQYLSGMELARVPRSKQVAASRQVERVAVKIDQSLSNALVAVANIAEVPLKTALLAVHLRVLSFITGQTEVVTGNVLNGRLEKLGSEKVLGLFLNTVPVRMKLAPSNWLSLLKAVFQVENQILSYRNFPLLEIQRLIDKRPLFDVGFNYTHFHVYEGILNLPQVEILDVDDFEETDFPLVAKFALVPGTSSVELDLVYDIQQFDSSQIEQYGQYYQAALTALATNPLAPHNQSLMSDEERHNWLLAANANAVNHLSDHTLVSAFDNAVKQHSQKVALSFGHTSLTFAELEANANRLAHYLKSKGVGAETLVGLCLERSEALIISILAILKAGGAYVPIDPSYPKERIDFIQRDSGISLLLTGRSAISQIESQIEVIVLEDIAAQLQNQSLAPVEAAILPEHPAYVIYTSGSTGIPKGCVVTHSNVIRLLKATESWFEFNSNDVWSLFHSYAFDFAVWELWGALLYGGKAVVVPYWTSRSPVDFLKLLHSEKVTVLNQTPSAFKQLLQAHNPETALNLRYIIFGGEALELQSLQPWFDRYGDQTQLINMYGITETTVHVTYRPISQVDVINNYGSVIGQPIPDVKLYILDEYLEPVPVGVPGELYVGGAGVTRGYLHHPRLTAQRFIPDLFTKVPNSRLYRSGDLARRLPNGDLEYLGRSDHQVKIRGFRIELGEIEACLTSHPQVKAAFVTARTESEGDTRIVAYFVPNENDDLIIVLRDLLSTKLPDYMMPSALVPLETIPLTPHGKVDTSVLPTPDWMQNVKPYVAPRNEVEANICSVMAGVLNLERVGVMDDFFDMGGDSIRVTQLVTRLQETYKTELPLPDVFHNGTPEGLAKLIESLLIEPQLSKTTTNIARASRQKRSVNLSNDGSLIANS